MFPATVSPWAHTIFRMPCAFCPEINVGRSLPFGPSVAVPFFEFRRHFMGAILIISIVLVYVFLCATSGIESVSAPAKKSTPPPARKN
jgi:hypothetical protein